MQYPWLVTVIVAEAYRGDPTDPLEWRFLSCAASAVEAERETRAELKLDASVQIKVVAR